MLAKDFSAHAAGGQTEFAADSTITSIAVGDGGRTGARVELKNNHGQLNQLARTLAHDKSLAATTLMAATIIMDGFHTDTPLAFNIFRKKLSSSPFRNINHKNLEFFFDMHDSRYFTDSDRARSTEQRLRNLLCQKALHHLGFSISKEAQPTTYQMLKELFACRQFAHLKGIGLPIPASGKLFTADELHTTLLKLQQYGKYLQDSINNYSKKSSPKALKQYAIMRTIQKGYHWLLAQYMVLADSIEHEPTVQFSVDSMSQLLSRPLDLWHDEAFVATVLDRLKPASRATAGYGAAAAAAGLMAAPAAAATTVTTSLLYTNTVYDESALVPETRPRSHAVTPTK
ncbi:MAG: hypothetical protein P1U34_00595 [Coxiellaceae bacterium]|nr:hypothetical protein [Coxiellaceae bacterium]